MTHGHEKSDSAIVAVKPTNKAEGSAAEQSAAEPTAAEPVERRAETKGNAGQQSTHRAQSRASVSQALERIRRVAKERKKEKFTSLFHHISIDLLDEAFFELKENAAPGVDGLTWKDYEQDLERNLEDLHARVHRGAYRALPSRRTYIPKPDGRQRPLAIAALEDKIVQRAAAAVLNAIYEEDFLGFSYGFRPGRGTHDALDALDVGINSTKVNWIVDADIRSFFDEISQEWLVRFLEHRIGDRRIIRLIQKWLRAGVLEEGVVTVSDKGTGEGSVVSPLLANVYLHYAFDLWAARWRRREATGAMIILRYADAVGLRALGLGAAVVDVLDREIELVLVALAAAELSATIGQHARQPDAVLVVERHHPIIEDFSGGDRGLAVIELGKGDFGVGIDDGLLIDPAHPFEGADIEGVLGTAIARTFALELAMRLLVGLGLLERGDLRLGEQDAILRHLGFERLEAMFHHGQIVALPHAAHPGRRDRHPAPPEHL